MNVKSALPLQADTARAMGSVMIRRSRRWTARFLRPLVHAYLKAQLARELRALPDSIRRDIGVPEHVINDVAADAAARRVDAWMRRIGGERTSS